MSQLSRVLRDVENNGLMFMCPGCKTSHMIYYGEGNGPRWVWNGNAEKPTFSPSVLVKTGHFAYTGKREKCWCNFDWSKYPDLKHKEKCTICHSFVTDGRIQFLSDCTHELAGQTVDLPEWPD